MNSLGQTYGGLTVAQLAQAAKDLRNAALVVQHAGYYKGSLVDVNTGMVCVVGAIELATYKRLEHRKFPGPHGDAYYGTPQRQYIDGGAYRAEAAIIALADFVPTGLCFDCTEHEPCRCHSAPCEAQPREPWEIVTHYNDQHCRSGTMAYNVLNLAADETEVRANIKRASVANALADAP